MNVFFLDEIDVCGDEAWDQHMEKRIPIERLSRDCKFWRRLVSALGMRAHFQRALAFLAIGCRRFL